MSAEKVSPWLKAVQRSRRVDRLDEDITSDVVIVGGGISGLATAYFILKYLDLNVTVLERDLVGHGASGHNAGQIVPAFERSFLDMAEQYGETAVADAYRELETGWELLQEIQDDMGKQMLEMTTGTMGFSDPDDVVMALREMERKRSNNVPYSKIYVSERIADQVPAELTDHATSISSGDLLYMLGSKDGRYIGLVESKVGVMNTALFCEAVAEHLLDRYKERIRIYERTDVTRMRYGDEAALTAEGHLALADHVVLCTNGYKGIRIEACSDAAVNRTIQGVVAYMIGFMEKKGTRPLVQVFFKRPRSLAEEPYYYLTALAWSKDKELISVGGPEDPLKGLDEKARSMREMDAYTNIQSFFSMTSLLDHGRTSPDFQWDGLMGYTRSRLRIIGRDPALEKLHYNLGCNGIGALPSIYGGWKVAREMAGKKMPPSIFDPAISSGQGIRIRA